MSQPRKPEPDVDVDASGRLKIKPKRNRHYEGRTRTKAEQEDHEYRHAGVGNKTLRAAYYARIGDAPQLRAGDTDGAQEYTNKIERALADGGWTGSEFRRLRALHTKWSRRASGADAYFMVYGTKRRVVDAPSTKTDVVKLAEKPQVDDINEIIRQETVRMRAQDGMRQRETPQEKSVRREIVDKLRAARRLNEEGED